jgi:transketolase C-terminal domain/subunit
MPPGPVRIERRGGVALLVGCGLSSHWAIDVQAALGDLGVQVDVASIAQVRPLPPEIDSLLADGRPIVVIEDHVRLGGLADQLTARSGRVPDLWFGWRDHPPGGEVDAVRAWGGLDTATLANAIRERFRL